MTRQRGFSLLEVMLAFALLTAGLGLLVAILGGGLVQVRQSADATGAALHAQSLLAELGALEPVRPGTRFGDFDDGAYRWEMTITEIEDPAPLPPTPVAPGEAPMEQPGLQMGEPRLLRVDLEVGWGEDDLARSLRFTTLRARLPEAMEGGLE